MSSKKWLFYVLLFAVLLSAVFAYSWTSIYYEKNAYDSGVVQDSESNNTKNNGDIEYVTTVTLKKDTDKKATFMDELPNFLPGRTDGKTIDKSFYKSSDFREGERFKLYRIYTRDNNGEVTHKYRFEKEVDN
ncbi:putative membrane protein [Staphylococcus phage Twort]|uniref:ORF096 n=2 Tax=Staphylococcus phage Twort (strain DSM 17442 / HER 48) TaxID=2908167 RepID=Q4Z973_BPTWO|nr:hypothetical protein TwortORF096 [Staphylococcus phage Twort]AAX92390.1 ORF096 [Staphylococcus phage Twort]QIW89169.1 putative membrane protein [Staphylococcus phage Twort]